MTTSDLGMSIQKFICDLYEVVPNSDALSQFNAVYDNQYNEPLFPIIQSIFNEIGTTPIKLTTFLSTEIGGNRFLTPYNFILENGKTLSIRTNKTSRKVSPRVIGQAGINTFNAFFSEIVNEVVNSQRQIREVIFSSIHLMLPVFIEYTFNADYTVWIYKDNLDFRYEIYNGYAHFDFDFDRENFTFTRGLENWTESTTLKYKGISIAEIQTHKNRNFKFRFQFENLKKFLNQNKVTTETFGITAEKAICDLFALKYPENFKTRFSPTMQADIESLIVDAFHSIPKPIKHTGSDKGIGSSSSKSSFDFILETNMTLSLKTNFGDYVCPPEVGQPSDKTFFRYFGQFIEEDYVDEIIFKNLVLEKVKEMLPIYLDHLFDSDFLLWIKKTDKAKYYRVVNRKDITSYKWDENLLSFTCTTIEQWNECNTLRYDNKTIGQFQFHRNRNCYKFRFHFENLLNLVLK